MVTSRTEEELLACATELRPALIADQEENERRTYYSQAMHEEFLDAGFYDLYVPRRYGGLELGVPAYVRVIQEVARGCVSTAWCVGLAMNHALMVGSWWPQEAQDEIFGNGDFRAGSVAAPVGTAAPTNDGWEINGQVAFASGAPYSTYYMGQAMLPNPDGDEPPPTLLFVAPREQWQMLDDWGDMLGLKGSGSHSIRFDHTRIRASWGFRGNMIDVDVAGGTPGWRLHGNSMYAGRAMSVFTISLGAVMVGAAYNMLDEYERLMRSKTTGMPPFQPRIQNREYQRWYGRALTHIATAEAALHRAADLHMELCRRNVEDGIDYQLRRRHARRRGRPRGDADVLERGRRRPVPDRGGRRGARRRAHGAHPARHGGGGRPPQPAAARYVVRRGGARGAGGAADPARYLIGPEVRSERAQLWIWMPCGPTPR
ncbi:MAG: acyl-CoA dehydrogenase family protein [Solirubrobacteraceae bacterium]